MQAFSNTTGNHEECIMRTLWVCNVSGGPFQFTATKPGTTPFGLEEVHRDLRNLPRRIR
jgi:hypothetical protein